MRKERGGEGEGGKEEVEPMRKEERVIRSDRLKCEGERARPHSPDNSREGKYVGKEVGQVAHCKHHNRLQDCNKPHHT